MIGSLLKSCVLDDDGTYVPSSVLSESDGRTRLFRRRVPVKLHLGVSDGILNLSLAAIGKGAWKEASSFVVGLSIRHKNRLIRNAVIWGQCCSSEEYCYKWPVEKLAKLVTPSMNRGLYAVTATIVLFNEQGRECREWWRAEELVSFYL